jgi:hypothetical protein
MEGSQPSNSSPKGFWSSSVSVGIPVLTGLVMLALVLTTADALLIAKNKALRRRVEGLIMASFAPVGATLPELSGKSVDGTPLDIDLVQSAPLILLLFEPSCAICDQNWPNWAKLTNDPQIGRQCLLVSANPKIPASYLERHQAGHRGALLGISPDIVRSFHLSSTPQTILVQSGRIVMTWPGVLSEADLREIKTGLMDLSEANH